MPFIRGAEMLVIMPRKVPYQTGWETLIWCLQGIKHHKGVKNATTKTAAAEMNWIFLDIKWIWKKKQKHDDDDVILH